MKKINNVNSNPVDGSLVVPKSKAGKLLKEHGNKVVNGDVDSFVSLKNINKIYPNGVQAVYDFNIDIEENDFIVLVGPSGCGKSTTLRMVAGLEDITSGYLYIDKVLSNYLPSKNRDISMVFQSYALYPQMTVYDNIAFPLKSRKYRKTYVAETSLSMQEVLKYLEQPNDYISALREATDKGLDNETKIEYVSTKLNISEKAVKFLVSNGVTSVEALEQVDSKGVICHDALVAKANQIMQKEITKITAKGYTLNENYEVLDNGNLVYINKKLNKEEIRRKVFEAAEILDLGPYLDRRPKELSGGQMQRVALGRAIVRDAKLFLMDEPLSNLDAKLRVQMRSEIVRIHEQIGATTIYVTHDQTEAMTMATKIAVMSKGWVQQIGTPQEIYNNPKNIFVATFIGSPAMNIVDGTYDNGVVKFNDGYSIKLSDNYVAAHDKFYNDKIADLKRMLAQDDFVKMHALLVYDDIVKNHADRLGELKNIVNDIKDEHGEAIRNALAQYDASKDEKVLHSIRKELLTFTKISSTDLGKLHNAQVFKKDAKVEDKTMHYQKRKPKVKKQKNANLNSTNVEFINNLYEVATNLLAKYEEAVKGVHPVRFGVRPENIHLNNECVIANKSNVLTLRSDIVELMGSELLIHSKWNDANFISKISTGTLVKPHIDVELALDLDKILLFDAYCGDTIK